MKRINKLLSIILIICMIVPGFAFANELDLEETTDDMIDINKFLERKVFDIDTYETIKPEEKVRVIVELEDSPTIVYATDSGVKYSSFSENNISKIERKLKNQQSIVKNMLLSNNVDISYMDSYTTVFNGFSGVVEYGKLDTIKQTPGVKEVYISNEYEKPEVRVDMNSSNEMVNALSTWELGYKGEGMVIAVIDTGMDPFHKDMVLSEGTQKKLDEEKVNEILALDPDMQGKYFTDKVPFGYNYYDLNNQIIDKSLRTSEHGMHVAGTVAANGDLKNGGVKGVAPEAQILAMKVFSNDTLFTTTFDDIYIKAIEDAVKLGADALNMSLGMAASFNDPENPTNKTIKRAAENGILCAISAGNSGHITLGWDDYNNGLPWKENPDIGVVGAPGMAVDAIQVASVENTHRKIRCLEYYEEQFVEDDDIVKEILPSNTVIVGENAYNIMYLNNNNEAQIDLIASYNNQESIYIKLSPTLVVDIKGSIVDNNKLPRSLKYYNAEGIESERIPVGKLESIGQKVPMTIGGKLDPSEVFDGQVEYLNCGFGSVNDFEDKNVMGKIALVERGGDILIVDKIINAQKSKAAGVIIYNHESGGDTLGMINYPPSGTIPAVFIGYSHGKKLLNLNNKYISFLKEEQIVETQNGGQISDFSSWGATPNLELKPEITAPGGNIYSTLQNNRYGTMSGTSMSSPHVAGGAALVAEYINKTPYYKDLTLKDKVNLNKILLMNTADIIMDDNNIPVSPRKQGAGLMNLKDAVNTPVTIVESSTGNSKVELKDFESTAFEMKLKAKNDSDKDLTYNIKVDLITDKVEKDNKTGIELNLLCGRKMDAEIDVPDTINIPANEEREFSIKIDFSKDQLKYRNMFVEGFITLEDENHAYPTIGIPYMGFYGNWDEPKILDGLYNVDEKSYYGIAGMIGFTLSQKPVYLNHMAMSPETIDGQVNGTSSIMPVLSFMRNAEKIEFNILDENKNNIRKLYSEKRIRKSYFEYGNNNPFKMFEKAEFDGKVNNVLLPEGNYYYQIRTLGDGERRVWQEKDIPLIIDQTKPEISDIHFDQETKKLSWVAEDKVSGVFGCLVEINGIVVTPKIVKSEEGTDNYKLDLTEFLLEDSLYSIKIHAIDKALNVQVKELEIPLNDGEPEIFLLSPVLFSLNNHRVEFYGYIFNNENIESVKIGDFTPYLAYKENIMIPDPSDPNGEKVLKSGPAYEFHKVYVFEDGVHEVPIVVKTKSGKEVSIVRRFYVDEKSPELDVKVQERDITSDIAVLEIKMKDNFPYLRLLINGSEEFQYDGIKDSGRVITMEPVEESMLFNVPLEIGKNTIELELFDAAGNKTVRKIEIDRQDVNSLAKKIEKR